MTRRYRFGFLRVDPEYPYWNWGLIALYALVLAVGIFVLSVAVFAQS